jgi:hypothetical protein
MSEKYEYGNQMWRYNIQEEEYEIFSPAESPLLSGPDRDMWAPRTA